MYQLGRLAESRDHFETALALYDPVRDRSSAAIYALDSRVVCPVVALPRALPSLVIRSRPWRGTSEALAYARELAHPNTLAYALCGAASSTSVVRDRGTPGTQAEAVMALATEQGLPLHLAVGTVVRGWALADGGRAEEAIAEMRRGLADYAATGAEMWSPYFLGLLAEAQGRAGRVAAGLDLTADALDRVGPIGGRWIEADLHRLRGELLLAPSRARAARGRGLLPPSLSRRRRAGREAVGAARRDQPRPAVAGPGEAGRRRATCSRPVYGWFTEGFDTPDLREAKALLDELSSTPRASRVARRRSAGS